MSNFSSNPSGPVAPKRFKIPTDDPAPMAPAVAAPTRSESQHNAASASTATCPLLAALWRSDRIHQLGTLDRQTKHFKNIHVKDTTEAVRRALALSGEGYDTYFALAEFKNPFSRSAENSVGASGFWVDIDCGESKAAARKGYATIDDARLALTQFCKEAELLEPTHTVDSGGGIHAYWILDKVVERSTWQAYAAKLKALTRALNFLADDSRTADIASVLRVPGTMNYKYEPPRQVALLHASDNFIEKSAMLQAIDLAHARLCPAVVKVATPNTVNVSANQSSHDRTSSTGGRVFSNAELRALLEQLDPDVEYGDWTKVSMAIHHVTGGSEDGLAIFDEWSRRGSKYKGSSEIRVKWRSFKTDRVNSYNIGTIINMVKTNGVDWMAVCSEAADPFEACETTVEYADHKLVATPQPAIQSKSKPRSAAKAETGIYTSAALDGIQQQFGLINFTGKLCLFDRFSLTSCTVKGNASRLILSNRSDGTLLIKRAVRSKFPQASADGVAEEFWLNPNTICYDGVDFNPIGTADNYLNLWLGPTIIAKVGRWELIRTFLLEIICGGDKGHYQYLVCYLAHALQRPEEKPGVMIILLGGQGIGKGTLARILNKIWVATFLQINNVDSVTGNFNASLERAYIVFMDEALFAGDRKAADSLKSLVTEPVVHINEKHQPARQTSSFHRFFAATNADHLKNTDRDDRRDFALRVSEARKGDFAYWTALNHEIGNGGVEAMVHDLLAMDLSGFNVRAKPDTKELMEQKVQSLGHIQRWWYECLCSGELSMDGDWPEFITTDYAIEEIWEMAGSRGYKKPAANDVVQALKKLCPSASKAQKKSDGLCRKRGFSLPPLDQARAEFDAYIGGAVKWDVPQNADDFETGAAASGET